MEKYYIYMQTPMGILKVTSTQEAITSLDRVDKEEEEKSCVLLEKARKQLDEYFERIRTSFDLPLQVEGTPFQKKVWKALCDIPYGETRSYKQIAQVIGNPKAMRAVGMANNRNAIMILIPCHRVIGANGALVGFGGGLAMKEYLLHLENPNKY